MDAIYFAFFAGICLCLINRTDRIMDKLGIPRMRIDRRWKLRRMTTEEFKAGYKL